MEIITCPHCHKPITLFKESEEQILKVLEEGGKRFNELVEATELSRVTVYGVLPDLIEAGLVIKLKKRYYITKGIPDNVIEQYRQVRKTIEEQVF